MSGKVVTCTEFLGTALPGEGTLSTSDETWTRVWQAGMFITGCQQNFSEEILTTALELIFKTYEGAIGNIYMVFSV